MLSKNFYTKRAGVLIGLQENRARNFAFKGGLFCFRYNHKGQVKFSSYTQYMSVFLNPVKPLFVRVTVFLVNFFYRANIVIFITIIVFL